MNGTRKMTVPYSIAGALLLWLCMSTAWGKTYYVSTAGSDGNVGTISLPFKTIKQGVKVMALGDSLYLRGGRYNESNISLNGKIGTPVKKYYIASYPNEWAIVDGGYPGDCAIFTATTAWGSAICYWKFERIEVTGAGHNPTKEAYNNNFYGKGFEFWTGHHIEFNRCYVHHNYGGGGPNGGAGISIMNKDGHGAQNITIKYCVVEENGWPGVNNENNQNIVLYADYHDAAKDIPSLDYPMQQNEIAYNLVIGSTIGIKTKSCQRIVLDNKGNLPTSLAGKNRGDKIHHNIIKGPSLCGIVYEQDFKQVYNNIIDLRGKKASGISNDPVYTRNDRETFYSVIYNNTIIGDAAYTYEGSALNIEHGNKNDAEGSNYDQFVDKYHPYIYCFNNIMYHTQKDVDFNIHLNVSYSKVPIPLRIFDWKTIHISNNFFGDRSVDVKAISMGKFISTIPAVMDSNTGYVVSINKFKDYSSGNVNFALPTTNLFLDKDLYRTNPDCIVNGTSVTVKNAGIGNAHPYLENQMLPKYIGATDPANYKWVDTVQNLLVTIKGNLPLEKASTSIDGFSSEKKLSTGLHMNRQFKAKVAIDGFISIDLAKGEYGNLTIDVYNLNGSRVANIKNKVEVGTSQIRFKLGSQKSNDKYYLCKVSN
jgi:hypothetical protein